MAGSRGFISKPVLTCRASHRFFRPPPIPSNPVIKGQFPAMFVARREEMTREREREQEEEGGEEGEEERILMKAGQSSRPEVCRRRHDVNPPVWVAGPERGLDVGVHEMDAGQLVAEGEPVGLAIVLPAKQLNFPRARRQPLDDAVDLVRLVARLSHLGHYDVAVDALVGDRAALHPNQAVLLAVVDPVAGAPRPNQPL